VKFRLSCLHLLKTKSYLFLVKHTYLIQILLKNLTKNSLRLAVVLLFLFIGNQGFSQIDKVGAAQQASALIKAKGLDEAEVRAALLAKGIDVDNLTPAQLPALQTTIEGVLAELEAKKASSAKASETAPSPISSEQLGGVQFPNAAIIGEKTLEGASVEEKAAEILSEKNQENLAPTEIYGHHLFRVKDLAIYRTTSEVKPPDS
jgi:hypothetical protein